MKSFVKVPSTFSSLISTIILTSFTSIEGTWQYKTNVDIELASRSSWSVSNQQSACLHWAYTSHILISNNIYQLTINHKPIKESRILRITVTIFFRPKVMPFDNAERDIYLSKHYFNPGDTRNNRYLSFIPRKHCLANQKPFFFIYLFCFCFCFPSVRKKLGNTISTFIQGNRPQTFPPVFILLEQTHC